MNSENWDEAARRLVEWERVGLLLFGKVPILAQVGDDVYIGSVSKLPGGLVSVQLSPTQLPKGLEAALQSTDECRLRVELPASVISRGYKGEFQEADLFRQQKYAAAAVA